MMWMKRLVAATAAIAMLGALSGCGSKNDSSTADNGNGLSNNKFVVGFDAAFPPYGYQDDSGEYVGFDLDLAQEVCSRNSWELVKMPIDWDSKDMELNSGTISCIWNGFTMNGREDDYTWSDPYVDNSQVFVVKSDSGITTFDDLSGKTVAVQTDSSAEAALNEEDNAALKDSFKELLVVGEYNTAFLNLEPMQLMQLQWTSGLQSISWNPEMAISPFWINRWQQNSMQLDLRRATKPCGIRYKIP